MLLIVIFNVVQVLASGFAGWRGGAPERVVAITMLVAAIATAALPWNQADAFTTVHIGLVVIDLLFLLVVAGVALVANRYWPIWIAAVQFLAVATHGAKAWDRTIWRQAYWLVSSYSAYVMIALLVAGTIRHRRRLLAGLPELDWYSPRRSANELPDGDSGQPGAGQSRS